MNRFFKTLATALVTVALAACGGGGGSSGSNPNGGGGGSGGGTNTPATDSMIYTLSKAALDNTGTDVSLLTVTALDANNNPVKGVPLSVSVNTGVYTPITIETDANGRLPATSASAPIAPTARSPPRSARGPSAPPPWWKSSAARSA
ncbi:Ig-like domain-containing protein [Ramlibacter terrae]|uniref:Ig-like domain-containing protein n=1 Tax=Ramlibacter terrae TaxID=2732511 RepID=A0ABX6P578_9BURK|nr:Ig-like domain-containing protein [Ramlibacter terrae]